MEVTVIKTKWDFTEGRNLINNNKNIKAVVVETEQINGITKPCCYILTRFKDRNTRKKIMSHLQEFELVQTRNIKDIFVKNIKTLQLANQLKTIK